jgi:hypothetical protein
MKIFGLTAAVAAIFLMSACVAGDEETQHTVTITSADLTSVPVGQALEVDLGRDVHYIFQLHNVADRDRVLLKYGDRSTTMSNWFDDAQAPGDASINLEDGGGACEGGWDVQCDGNVCCSICPTTGELGNCKKAT